MKARNFTVWPFDATRTDVRCEGCGQTVAGKIHRGDSLSKLLSCVAGHRCPPIVQPGLDMLSIDE